VETKRIRTKSAFREMFKYKNHITHTLSRLTSIDSKRKAIEVSSGHLWYIFGYKLISKPWLTYQERFCEDRS
jgi:hypothetical protein